MYCNPIKGWFLKLLFILALLDIILWFNGFEGEINDRLYIKPKGLLLPSDNCSILFLNWIELI